MMLAALRDYVGKTKTDWNYITPLDFYEQYYLDKARRHEYVLVDLRKKSEFDDFHVRGAKNIFWMDILDDKNLALLPKDKKIFLICYVGHTSSQVMVLLKLLGYDVVSIKFGYGITPVFKVPVAGWASYNLPVYHKRKNTNAAKTKFQT